MGVVTHLFGEDVGRVDFTGNVPDFNCLVLDPFAKKNCEAQYDVPP
jgi:hypothetical protein